MIYTTFQKFGSVMLYALLGTVGGAKCLLLFVHVSDAPLFKSLDFERNLYFYLAGTP